MTQTSKTSQPALFH